MPIYEFVCQSCGTEFEQIRSFSENSVPACVACHSTQVVRSMSRPAIHFKGSGWYITDSKKSSDSKDSSKSSGESSENKSENKSEGKNENKSESKIETKSESTTESKSDANKKSESTPKSAPASVTTD